MKLDELTDGDLFSRLQAICVDARRIDMSLIVHLMEVQRRRLDLASACSSLFDFCVRRLGMSEGAAFRRITVARLAGRHPCLLDHLERGTVTLSTLVLLRDHLTEANVEELVAAASGRSKREVAELLAARAPRPDVPSTIRKLPSTVATGTTAASTPPATALPGPAAVSARIEPLAPARYKVQLTASAELRDKLERAVNLMRHRNPTGDLTVVLEAAIDLLLAKMEKERLGRARRPLRTRRPAKPGHVARAARRAVFERDGEQCSFVDDQDRRCPARAFLEVDHIECRALGGSSEESNLRVLCRAHNRLHAERVFGAPHVERQTHLRQRKCGPAGDTTGHRESATMEMATRGLVSLGFRDTEARRAVRIVSARHRAAVPVVEILREALGVLTSTRDPPAGG